MDYLDYVTLRGDVSWDMHPNLCSRLLCGPTAEWIPGSIPGDAALSSDLMIHPSAGLVETTLRPASIVKIARKTGADRVMGSTSKG